MKREAKQRAKAANTSYNATLEEVAREHGFASWYAVMQQHKSATPAPAGDRDLPIDPELPPGFDDTPNDDRSDAEIERWWMRPFARKLGDGRYEVRCLDGGAWDRSTWYGIADDLEGARSLAKAKLAKWRSFMDTPVLTLDRESRCSLTVDSLRPGFPRAVLASFPDQALALQWLEGWNSSLHTDPELAQIKLARARWRAVNWMLPEENMADTSNLKPKDQKKDPSPESGGS